MATLDQLLLARSAQSQKRIQQMSNNMAVEVQLNEFCSQPELSSLKRVIEAMGGQLRLEVTLPDGDRVEVIV